ncbi:phospholipid phosphatase [Psychrobacillus sp. INOP01]|uniref:phospholipid phosphatase n=1 Tax=Psychrobacillus sp. INOP01 TaxID=2829187 RepID=UPI001BA8AEC1|nr:phospholipid phosphatase [Psychrobacillus sp. INOP01]QUG41527.1 phospholipid phosphatase [Psychrobacillus sp. INOP01]
MDTFLYFLYATLYTVLLVWGLYGIGKFELTKWTSVIYIVILPLIYDNAILATGKWIGEGELLESLNFSRFCLHALITPLLVMYSIGTLQESGIKWAKKKWFVTSGSIYTIGLMVLEFSLEVVGLEIEIVKEYGVISYSNVEEATGPPIMVLLVVLILIVASAILWNKTKWPVFFIGAIVMTIGSAVPINVGSGALTNAFELFLIFTLIWTKRRLITNQLYIK